MNLLSRFAALSLTAAVFSPALRAELTPLDYVAAGDNLVTLDSATQLEWLDLTATVGHRTTELAALTSESGPFAGFRLATDLEFHALLKNAGIVESNIGLSEPLSLAATAKLQSLIGSIRLQINTPPVGIVGYGDFTLGLLSSTESGSTYGLGHLMVYHFNSGLETYRAEERSIFPSFNDPSYGLYLVRGAAVPEPSAYGSFAAAALLVLTFWRRKKAG